MITNDERVRVRSILRSITKPLPWRWWTSCSFRRLKSDSVPGDVAYGAEQRDGVGDIVIRQEDMAYLETAANVLPAALDALDEMERRIAEVDRIIAAMPEPPPVLIRVRDILRGDR